MGLLIIRKRDKQEALYNDCAFVLEPASLDHCCRSFVTINSNTTRFRWCQISNSFYPTFSSTAIKRCFLYYWSIQLNYLSINSKRWPSLYLFFLRLIPQQLHLHNKSSFENSHIRSLIVHIRLLLKYFCKSIQYSCSHNILLPYWTQCIPIVIMKRELSGHCWSSETKGWMEKFASCTCLMALPISRW